MEPSCLPTSCAIASPTRPVVALRSACRSPSTSDPQGMDSSHSPLTALLGVWDPRLHPHDTLVGWSSAGEIFVPTCEIRREAAGWTIEGCESLTSGNAIIEFRPTWGPSRVCTANGRRLCRRRRDPP
jgi:hypothetical protein